MVLLGCVLGYFLLMGVLTLYTTHKEKGIFVIAHSGESRWEASSSLKKYDDQYELLLSHRAGKDGRSREAQSKRSVAYYFDENGTLLMEQVEPEVMKLHNSLLSGRKSK